MRELTRNITRRVADTVITLTPEGLLVRRFRRQRGISERLIKYAVLLDLCGADPLPSGTRAFQHAMPAGWMPKAGETVWAKVGLGTYRRGCVQCLIPAVPEPMVSVVCKGAIESRVFERCDLRPAKPLKDKPRELLGEHSNDEPIKKAKAKRKVKAKKAAKTKD